MANNSHYITVQSSVPRHVSIRNQLSTLSWQNGSSTFFKNGIPFSFSSGYQYASFLVQSISFLASKRPNTETLHLVECGAGSGLLSLFVLSLLKTDFPDLYARIHIHISDASTEQITDLERFHLFEDHVGHYSIEVLDISDITFSHPPLITYFSNLIDSTPAHHLTYDDGSFYESVITTKIPANAELIDTSVLPPKLLDAQAICDLLQSNDDSRKKLLCIPLANILVETYTSAPFDLTAIPSEDATDLRDFFAVNAPETPCRFNYHPLFLPFFRQCLQHLSSESALILTDFGDTELPCFPKEQDLISIYKSSCFTRVFFPLLAHISTSKKREASSISMGKGQHCVFMSYHGSSPDGFSELLTQEKEVISISDIQDVVSHLKNLISTPSQVPLSQLIDPYLSLPPNKQKNYSVTSSLSACLNVHGYKEEALTYINIGLDLLGPLAIPSYILRGYLYLDEGRFDEAEACFKHVIQFSNGSITEPYLGYCQCLLKTNRTDAFILAYCDLITHSSSPKIFSLLASLAPLYPAEDNPSLPIELAQFVLYADIHSSFEVPQSAVEKARQFLCKQL